MVPAYLYDDHCHLQSGEIKVWHEICKDLLILCSPYECAHISQRLFCWGSWCLSIDWVPVHCVKECGCIVCTPYQSYHNAHCALYTWYFFSFLNGRKMTTVVTMHVREMVRVRWLMFQFIAQRVDGQTWYLSKSSLLALLVTYIISVNDEDGVVSQLADVFANHSWPQRLHWELCAISIQGT